MGRIMRRIGTGSATQRVELGGKIDGIEGLTLTAGAKINNVNGVKANLDANKILTISGYVYVNSALNANEEIFDLGKSFNQEFSYAYSLGNGVYPIKTDGTKLKANVNIPIGNLYFSSVINI